MSPADNTPNFDSMTPEEIMRWMESLAKKQGADQGFTTAADMDIPDIDPDSVVIDEPGYVPSEGKDRGKRIETIIPPRQPKPAAAPAAQAPAAAAPPPVEPPAPVVQKPAAELPPTPAPAAPVAQPAAEAESLSGLSWLESLAADQGGDFPSLDLSSITADLNPAAEAPAATANPIDWLESLSLGQAADLPPAPPAEAVPAEGLEDPNSWLGSLAMGLGGDAPDAPPAEAVPAEGLEDPNSWLGSLAMGLGGDAPDAQPAAAASAEDDSMAWMESLAKRQGAKGEELITSGDMDIPAVSAAQTDGPGYVDYTFETPTAPVSAQAEFTLPAEPAPAASSDLSNLQDPAAWLDALASAQSTEGKVIESKPAAEPKMADDEIQKALAKGEYVPHDQMEAWMNRQLEIGAQRTEPEELSAYDPDAPAVKADIPDWLLEQVGSMPPAEAEPETIAPQPLPPSGPALIDAILEPPAVENIPDWLKEESGSESELENIFAPAEPAPVAPTATRVTAETVSGIEIDPNDPWVEALEMEYAQNKGVPAPAASAPPAAPVTPPPAAAAPAAALKDAALQPESELPLGQPEPIPDWLQGVVDAPEAEAISDVPDWLMNEMPVEAAPVAALIDEEPAAISEIPDWLKSIDMEATDVPGWLTETLSTDTSEEYVAPVTIVQPTPAPAAAAPPPAPVAPAAAIVPARPSLSPAPIQVTNIDVPATLNNARSLASGNDIDGSLQHYELLIRANAELDAVVGDLSKITEKVKTNSAVFRVLGDGLMRKGQLQAALDIYRKALNQL